MNINERLKEMRKYRNLSQQELAQKMGMSQNAISWSEKSGNNVPDSTIKSFCALLHISEDYIRHGIEPKEVQSNTFSLDDFVKEHDGSDLELEIMKAYFELPKDFRNKLIEHFQNRFVSKSDLDIEKIRSETPSTPEELEALYPPIEAPKKSVG